VKNAYYALLLANDSKKVIQESYDMAALTYDIYSKQHSVGAASEYDVLRTSVAMKNVEPELLQADISIKQARLQLLILMGVSADTPFNFSGELTEYEKTMYDDVLALGNDYSNNSSLVLQRLQTNTLARTLKVQKMSLLPTLALSANYNWTSSSDGNPLRNFRWNPYSYVALSLSVPLFQGGQRAARIKQAQVQLWQADLQREDLERSVSMQVTLAQDNIRLNVKQIASCAESVAQAERAYDIMSRSFDIGAASYLELRDSQLALTQSRLSRFQAIYNYLIAGAQLELLLGNAVPVNNTDNN
jgi:outer membrane protein TolC